MEDNHEPGPSRSSDEQRQGDCIIVRCRNNRDCGIKSTPPTLAITDQHVGHLPTTTAFSQVMRALVEFAQGNEGNKLAIATPSLSVTINDLFWQRCVFAFPCVDVFLWMKTPTVFFLRASAGARDVGGHCDASLPISFKSRRT